MAAEAANPPPYSPPMKDIIERTVVVAGQSGAGKSTFLQTVFGVQGVVIASGGAAGTMKPVIRKKTIEIDPTTRLVLTLVDTPGFTDGTNTVESVVKATKQLLRKHDVPGIHALFVFLDGKARRASDFFDRMKEGLKEFVARRANYDDTHGVAVMTKAKSRGEAVAAYDEFRRSGGIAATFINGVVHGNLDFFNLLPDVDEDDDAEDIEKTIRKREKRIVQCRQRMLDHIMLAEDLKFIDFLKPRQSSDSKGVSKVKQQPRQSGGGGGGCTIL